MSETTAADIVELEAKVEKLELENRVMRIYINHRRTFDLDVSFRSSRGTVGRYEL